MVNESFRSGRGLAPIVETPNIAFGANDFTIRQLMNKTGPNFLKSSRHNINLDESLDSEMVDEMHSFIGEQPTSVSRRKNSGPAFPNMPSISSNG